MTYEELQEKIADVEDLINDKYKAAEKAYWMYCRECVEQGKVIVKPEPQRSQFERQALISIDRLKKEYAMQDSPADVGDIIESERRVLVKGNMRETRYLMKVERIEVAAFEKPTLAFYGTYLNQKLEPRVQQILRPILQPDITRVVKVNK
jgi:hypothetical protein